MIGLNNAHLEHCDNYCQLSILVRGVGYRCDGTDIARHSSPNDVDHTVPNERDGQMQGRLKRTNETNLKEYYGSRPMCFRA